MWLHACVSRLLCPYSSKPIECFTGTGFSVCFSLCAYSEVDREVLSSARMRTRHMVTQERGWTECVKAVQGSGWHCHPVYYRSPETPSAATVPGAIRLKHSTAHGRGAQASAIRQYLPTDHPLFLVACKASMARLGRTVNHMAGASSCTSPRESARPRGGSSGHPPCDAGRKPCSNGAIKTSFGATSVHLLRQLSQQLCSREERRHIETCYVQHRAHAARQREW